MLRFRKAIAKARTLRQTMNDLQAYLNDTGDKSARWLARKVQDWGEFSYSELASAIEDGRLDDLLDWQSLYAEIVNEHFAPLWASAMAAAALKATGGKVVLSDSDEAVQTWIRTRGGELISGLSEESRRAVMNIILRGQALAEDPRRLAQEIRPLIGLNQRQAQANVTYRERVYQRFIERGLSPSKAAEKSDVAALRYAGKQHRYRAETIVNTEMAFAYNRGAHMGVGQAIANGYMGRCEMVWSTAGTNRVCSRCLELKGRVVGHTDESSVTIPPLHPRCRCTIMYQEVEPAKALRPNKPQADLRERHTTLTGELESNNKKWQKLRDKIYQANQSNDQKKLQALYAEESRLSNTLYSLEQELKAVRIEGARNKTIFATGLERAAYETDDITAILDLLQNAPEDFRLTWNLNEDKIKILDKASRKSYYSPWDRGIYIDAFEDRTSSLQKSFKIIFHETGHLIDHASTQYTHFTSYGYNQDEFGNMLRSEGKAYLKVIQARLKQEAIISGRSVKDIKAADVQKELSRELRQITIVNRREVSDIWDGLTKSKANGGFGHGAKYWRDDPRALGEEAFAHMFCATIQNPEALIEIKKYFPKSYKVFEKMIHEYVEEAVK